MIGNDTEDLLQNAKRIELQTRAPQFLDIRPFLELLVGSKEGLEVLVNDHTVVHPVQSLRDLHANHGHVEGLPTGTTRFSSRLFDRRKQGWKWKPQGL